MVHFMGGSVSDHGRIGFPLVGMTRVVHVHFNEGPLSSDLFSLSQLFFRWVLDAFKVSVLLANNSNGIE